MFGRNTHMISLTNIGYGILALKVIKGHWRSLEVKKYMIYLGNIGLIILTPIIKERSNLENKHVTNQNTRIYSGL